MEDKKSYLQKLADQFRKRDAEVDELKTRAGKAKAESRTEFLTRLSDMRQETLPWGHYRGGRWGNNRGSDRK